MSLSVVITRNREAGSVSFGKCLFSSLFPSQANCFLRGRDFSFYIYLFIYLFLAPATIMSRYLIQRLRLASFIELRKLLILLRRILVQFNIGVR